MFRLLPRTLFAARPTVWSITTARSVRSFSNTPQLFATVSRTKPLKAKPKPTKKPGAKAASKSVRPSSRATTAKKLIAKKSTAKKTTAKSVKKLTTKKAATKSIKKPVKKKPQEPKIKIPPLQGPKKPGNSFSLFLKDAFKEERGKNPDMKVTDICKLAAARWKDLPENEKLVYQDKSVKAKADFEQAHQKFLESLTPLDYARENERRRAKKKKPMKDPNLPKRPRTGFMLFAGEMMKQPEFAIEPSVTQRISAISKKWNSMDANEKKIYMDKHAEDRERYIAEKAVYTKQLQQLKDANPLQAI